MLSKMTKMKNIALQNEPIALQITNDTNVFYESETIKSFLEKRFTKLLWILI